MQVIVLQQPGGAENLIYRETPEPVIREGEVLVKVHRISINPVDVKTRQGKGAFTRMGLHPDEARILGWDMSGTVEATQSDAFSVGDEVFGMVNFPGLGAAYAEYVAAPAAHLARKPDNISHSKAAGATLAALTAWQNEVHHANVQPGQRVLIHAAAGGVGHYAVQIAKHLGAYVIGTSSAANRDFILSLGADEHVDYKAQPLAEAVRDVDFVLDSLGTESILQSLKVIKPGGKLISIVGGITDEVKTKAAAASVQTESTLVESSGEDMKTIAGLLQAGVLVSHISREFAFSEMAEAHNQIEGGRTVGKVVVNM